MASANFYNEPDRDSEDWSEDVGQNLDTFVRLSKAGQFRRANKYYRDVLERYSDQIAVVASYADSLIDQGAFRKAESLLLASLARESDNDIEILNIQDDESCVLRLMLAIARIYIYCDWKQAQMLVEKVQNTAETLCIDSETPPLKLQIAVLSLRLTDLLLRMSEHDRTLNITLQLEAPFRANAASFSRSSWEESIINLLKHDYLWEAQTLYMMILRYPTLQTQIHYERIIQSIPEEDDSMYTLVTLTMLAGTLLYRREPLQHSASSLKLLALYDHWQNILCHDVTRLTRRIESIDLSIADTRAFALILLACLTSRNPEDDGGDELASLLPTVESQWLPGGVRLWTAKIYSAVRNHMRRVAAVHEDHMFSLIICEASNRTMLEDWLEKTGASRSAIRMIHPKVPLEQDMFFDGFRSFDYPMPRTLHHAHMAPFEDRRTHRNIKIGESRSHIDNSYRESLTLGDRVNNAQNPDAETKEDRPVGENYPFGD